MCLKRHQQGTRTASLCFLLSPSLRIPQYTKVPCCPNSCDISQKLILVCSRAGFGNPKDNATCHRWHTLNLHRLFSRFLRMRPVPRSIPRSVILDLPFLDERANLFGKIKHKPASRTRWRVPEPEKPYECGWSGCNNRYDTISDLNDHIILKEHGRRRTWEDFPEFCDWQQNQRGRILEAPPSVIYFYLVKLLPDYGQPIGIGGLLIDR
ncbi:hypothetical protein B0T24DRAFT_328220 [Lasiosphaeria ovina]|uniref:C2H2-type domain-containing protein n=1 Tax=Lasiosphaeria ovina TaxID=92902 RepID=A0AAE0N5M9_9PEZI|nr:hypothetical protein B0T24DRAFT_328220 [Lasiosphaeria ovina]